MKGLTLTQPWASLVAFGEKGVETRKWSTRYRGPLAIHAALNLGPVGGLRGLRRIVETEPFASTLRVHLPGYTTEEIVAGLPRGYIVAIVNLNACRMVQPNGEPEYVRGLTWFSDGLCPHERAFGDYTPGRYAWHLSERQRLIDPVECHGARLLWNVPASVERAIEAQHWEAAREAAIVEADAREDRELDRALRRRP